MEFCKRGHFECELGTLLMKKLGEHITVSFEHFDSTREAQQTCNLLKENKVQWCRSMNNTAVAEEVAGIARDELKKETNAYVTRVYVVYTWSYYNQGFLSVAYIGVETVPETSETRGAMRKRQLERIGKETYQSYSYLTGIA